MKNLKLDSSIHPLLFDLLFHIKARMKRVVKEVGADLSPLQILILRTLVEDGEMSQHTLGKKIAKDKAQITRLIHGLEERKLIIKERSQQDKRSFIVKANQGVHQVVSHFLEQERNMVANMLEGATQSDIKHLEKMLLLMNANLKNQA